VLGQLVSAGYVDLKALGYLVGQLVEHADGPVDRGQAQPADFGQLHVVVVVTSTATGHIDIDHHLRGRGQQQSGVVVFAAHGRDVIVVVVVSGRRQSRRAMRIARFTDFSRSFALVWPTEFALFTRRRRLTARPDKRVPPPPPPRVITQSTHEQQQLTCPVHASIFLAATCALPSG